MEAKVIAQLQRALEPCLKKVRVQWRSLPVKQAPFVIRPVFNGERLVVYGLIEDTKDIPAETEIALEGIGPEGTTLTFNMQLDFSKAVNGNTVHKLAAKSLLR